MYSNPIFRDSMEVLSYSLPWPGQQLSTIFYTCLDSQCIGNAARPAHSTWHVSYRLVTLSWPSDGRALDMILYSHLYPTLSHISHLLFKRNMLPSYFYLICFHLFSSLI